MHTGREYLAVDIGASSGRHMVARLENGRMRMKEVYRFENGNKAIPDEKAGKKLVWDTEHLFREIVNGMKAAHREGYAPCSMSIDTWAVDYVLLDEEGRRLGDAYGYRDHRTEGMDAVVGRVLSEEALYARTGIQKQIFNTIYQLTADREKRPEILAKAKTFLMLPDYFTYLLTGEKYAEYTNATSTQLVDPVTKQWDRELIRMLDLPEEIFLPLSLPGTRAGRLRPELAAEVGFDAEVLLCATHDTASAVMAMPGTGDGIFLSSGTWSLMGTELPEALRDEASRKANFTNEGGYDYRFRYLKNIMGLWMIQSVRHELSDAYSFAQLCEMAEAEKDFPARVDVNDPSFLSPENMTEAIQTYCKEQGQQVPETPGQLAAVIYQSLADSYRAAASAIEQNTGRTYDRIYIIGGGAHADYLNRLTAEATGKEVLAGPSEATAIGNLAAQMLAAGELNSLQEARDVIRDSFEIKTYGKKQKCKKCNEKTGKA
ncbi:MAG: rhamnulokinase [Lachnospiraceae bacterium]|nr:rhamnulokinase [Lachnospiraceae bacterium]